MVNMYAIKRVFDLLQSGYLSALPYLLMGIVVLSSGCLADYLRARVQVETQVVRKLFTCGGKKMLGCRWKGGAQTLHIWR